MRHVVYILVLVCGLGCKNQIDDRVRFTTWVSSPEETKHMRVTLAAYDMAERVKYEPIPGSYSEKVQLMLGTKTAPDIFYLKGETAPSYFSFDIIRPVDDLVAASSEFDLDDFYPALLEAFKWQGGLFGLPKDFSTYVLFYNKDLFEQAGIETPPTTWAAFRTACAKVDSLSDSHYGFVLEPSIEMVMPFVFQNGGDVDDENGNIAISSPAFMGGLEFYVNLYRDGLATVPQNHGGSWNGDFFARNKVGMCISGSWMIPFLKRENADGTITNKVNYGVAQLPAGKQKATLAFTVAYAMPKYKTEPVEAWRLLQYMAGKQGMKKWTETGIALPSRRSVAKENGFYEDPITKVFLESVEFARVSQFNYNERFKVEFDAVMQRILFDPEQDTDIEAAISDLEQRVEKYQIRE